MSSKSTTKTTLALIPYLNCEPFYQGLNELEYDIRREVPRELGKLARSGAATCGPMAVADYFRVRDRFDLLGDFGIATEGAAHSVLLFSQRPMSELSGAKIGLTNESSTSVRLLKAILQLKLSLRDVEYVRGPSEEDDARLLIGDEALIAASEGLDDFPFVFDLGEEWYGWQGLPFVFARWVVAKEVPESDRTRIIETIDGSLDSWRLRVPAIAAKRGPDLLLDGEGVLRYLSTFRYRVGPVEQLGEQMFESMIEELE